MRLHGRVGRGCYARELPPLTAAAALCGAQRALGPRRARRGAPLLVSAALAVQSFHAAAILQPLIHYAALLLTGLPQVRWAAQAAAVALMNKGLEEARTLAK